MTVRTRFAPSPTGYLHIGGARTALYAYLWARKHQGEFILRIEDTDRTRYKPEAEDSIFEGLKWLGMDWDGDIIRQSDRASIHQEAAQQLLEQEKAYRCFCTPEQLNTMREILRKKNRAPRYDKRCLRLSADEVAHNLEQNMSFVVRLNIPDEGEITVNDLVRGDITFQLAELDDQVLLKSDGFPTYHLANVVDDHASEITHVIRGEEWIPSTPKHIMLYQAFGWEAPQFAHLSLFINKGGGKLSKREGALSVLEYEKQGYLPEAIVNFIALLGWNPKTEQEMFSMEQLVEAFELSNVNTANPIFDTDKLDWFSGQYIKQLPAQELLAYCKPHLPESDDDYLLKIVALEQDRLKRFSDIAASTTYFFSETLDYEADLLHWKKNTAEQTTSYLSLMLEQLTSVEEWSKEALEAAIIPWVKEQEFGNGDILWPTRVALTGQKASPSPFEVAAVLGKSATVSRIEAAISKLT